MCKPLVYLALGGAMWMLLGACHHSATPAGSGAGATGGDAGSTAGAPGSGGSGTGGSGTGGSSTGGSGGGVVGTGGSGAGGSGGVAPPSAADAAPPVDGPAIVVKLDAAAPATPAAKALVAALDLQRFKDNIKALSGFGDRLQGTPSFDTAQAWLAKQLGDAGYQVETVSYTFGGGNRVDTFATKVGTKSPDKMYIVSSHIDGRGGGGAADDNGSGVSLVLEVARTLARPGVETDVSVRFAFWDSEETGFQGASAYIRERGPRQGMEDPPGSHKFPEPRWLGIIQHDMLLYDHGLPPGPTQRPNADINIDYQASSKMAAQSRDLAETLAAGAKVHAHDYPPTVGNNMEGTDSVAFRDLIPSISMREARRVEEILMGSNPNHHKATDVYDSYSELDFKLGFNILEATMGTIADLAGARAP